MTDIRGYHAHVYFDESSKNRARALCEAARDRFGAEMGRMHDRPVGPHPEPSCQLAFGPGTLAEILPWLALNRDGLTVFTHPDTGDDLADHRDHAIWMGSMPALDLSIFDAG
jgi:DOPA 4,5-dioxygenase